MRMIERWLEHRAFVKGKACCVCKHFKWFHGSAGVCQTKNCCNIKRMRDYSDSCDCGEFKALKFKWFNKW